MFLLLKKKKKKETVYHNDSIPSKILAQLNQKERDKLSL